MNIAFSSSRDFSPDPSRKTKVSLFFFSLLIFIAFTSTTVLAQNKIVIGAFEFPPIYQNEVDKGTSGDLALAALKAAGVDAEIRFYPVARMVKAIAEGEMLCGLGGKVLFAAPEVAEAVRISSVVQYVSQVFYYDTRKYPQGITFEQLDDLATYRIGVLDSSGIMRILSDSGKLRLGRNRTHEGLAKQLAMERIDLWATVDLTGLMYIKELFPADAKYYKYSQPFNRGDVSFVCSKILDPDNTYGRRFDEGMKKIMKNGTYMEIMARYYGGREQINRESLPDELRRLMR